VTADPPRQSEERLLAAAGVAAAPREHRKRGASALPYLLGVGVVFLTLAFWSGARTWIAQRADFEGLLCAALAFLALHGAYQSVTIHRLRERLLDLLAETMASLKGPQLARDAGAIDILVKALASPNPEVRRSAHGHLVRLTGTDHGESPESWSKWWANARARAFETHRGGAT
jgi:hypothetical protein